MDTPENTGILSKSQRRLAGAAIALMAVTWIFVFLIGVFLVLRSFVQTFSAVLWPLAVAGILALILRPMVQQLEKRVNLSRRGSIVILYVLVLLVLLFLASLVLPTVITQAILFLEAFPEIVRNLNTGLSQRFPEIAALLEKYLGEDWIAQLQAVFSENAGRIAEVSIPALNRMGAWFSGVLTWGAAMAIIPVYLFFLLETKRDIGEDLNSQLTFIKENWRDDIVFLVREFVDSIVAFFRGQILIAAIMSVLLALGFTLSGINFGILLGLFLGFLNIIPYLGTILGMGTVLPIAYFQPGGGMIPVLLALLVFAVVQIIEGYLLTPRIMGKQTGLHPMVIIIAIFFWGTALNGILGMILAIPLTAFIVVAWRLLRRKYFPEISGECASETS